MKQRLLQTIFKFLAKILSDVEVSSYASISGIIKNGLKGENFQFKLDKDYNIILLDPKVDVYALPKFTSVRIDIQTVKTLDMHGDIINDVDSFEIKLHQLLKMKFKRQRFVLLHDPEDAMNPTLICMNGVLLKDNLPFLLVKFLNIGNLLKLV